MGKDPWGPLEAWDNCSAVIRTLENEPNTETFRQEYGYDYDETTAWSDFIYELEGTPLLNSDPVLLLVAEPDILRGLGFFSSLNNDLSERSRPVPTTRLRPRPSNTRVRQSHTMLKLRHRSSLPARPEATSGRASVDSRFNSAASTSKIRNSYFAASLCAPGNEKRGKVLAIPRFSLPMPGPVISLPSPG